MEDYILLKKGANFFGFERIDVYGNRHYEPYVIRGAGDLLLTENGVVFKQWGIEKRYDIPLDAITRVDIRAWHNMKMKWPGKVLRIYYKEDNETKIFGAKVGGKLTITGGWNDNAYAWKQKIDALLAKAKQS
jgi:hypothetical protein